MENVVDVRYSGNPCRSELKILSGSEPMCGQQYYIPVFRDAQETGTDFAGYSAGWISE
jgi:hypothetical protein